MSNPVDQPLASKQILRVAVVLVVVLALVAGYYQTTLGSERKKYLRLEDKYVRVRDQLGVEETQRLIDESHQEKTP